MKFWLISKFLEMKMYFYVQKDLWYYICFCRYVYVNIVDMYDMIKEYIVLGICRYFKKYVLNCFFLIYSLIY